MRILKKDNMISINGRTVQFRCTVDTVIEFPRCCVVMLMDDTVPDNNVEAIDYEGNRLWNISQIIRLSYPEAYVSLSKESESSFSVVSYSGVRCVVEISTLKISHHSITK